MGNSTLFNQFYFKMGILLLALVIAGFGSAAIALGRPPLELPLLFHIHGITFVLWYLLFIYQASLIGKHNYALHKQLGYSSVIIVAAMLVTGFLMALGSYVRGMSPVPDMTVQNFLAFPILDLLGLTFFYVLGVVNRNKPVVHKHAMLIMSIAIMDPALARLSFVIGFPPFALLLHIVLVSLVIFYDRKSAGKVHWVTWLGLGYIIARITFIFTAGGSEAWANLMNSIFG